MEANGDLPKIDDWFKPFDSIVMRHDAGRVFADWLHMAVCAHSHGAMEEDFKRLSKDYDKSEMQAFSCMLGEWYRLTIHESERKGWFDALGVYYEETLSRRKASSMGQFFTPHEVCDVITSVTGSHERGLVNDPACGSGRLLISHKAANPTHRCYYVGCDLDLMCVHMTALNMLINGMRGEVLWMDTLRMKIHRAFLVNPYLEDLNCPSIMPAGLHATYFGKGRPPFFGVYEEAIAMRNSEKSEAQVEAEPVLDVEPPQPETIPAPTPDMGPELSPGAQLSLF